MCERKNKVKEELKSEETMYSKIIRKDKMFAIIKTCEGVNIECDKFKGYEVYDFQKFLNRVSVNPIMATIVKINEEHTQIVSYEHFQNHQGVDAYIFFSDNYYHMLEVKFDFDTLSTNGNLKLKNTLKKIKKELDLFGFAWEEETTEMLTRGISN